MANELPTSGEIVVAATTGIRDNKNSEPIAGLCWRQTRLRLAVAGVPQRYIPPVGVDAMGAARWYREHHPDRVKTNGSLPGDVLFYENHHGPHGHVVTRVPGNLGAENSTAHAPEGEKDGRGYRPLSRLGVPSLVVRLWEAE